MNLLENLTTKNIKEFQPGDTLYITLSHFSGSMQHHTFLADFLEYNPEKNTVKAKLTQAAPNPPDSYHKTKIGEEIEILLKYCSLYGIDKAGKYSRFHNFDPLGYATHASQEEKVKRVPQKHPSYGNISIAKVTSNTNQPHFGSSILERNFIQLQINEASIQRDLNKDYIHDKKNIITVQMTTQQFAEMLTSPNSTGNPVTIVHRAKYNGEEEIPETPYVSKMEQFQGEFEERIQEIQEDTARLLNDAQELLNKKGTLKKDEKEHLIKLIQKIGREIDANIPFIHSQFQKQITKTLGEAKAAIHNFTQEERKNAGLPPTNDHPTLLTD